MKIANQTKRTSNSRFEAVFSQALGSKAQASFSRVLLTHELLKSAKGVMKRTLMGIDLFAATKLSQQENTLHTNAIRC